MIPVSQGCSMDQTIMYYYYKDKKHLALSLDNRRYPRDMIFTWEMQPFLHSPPGQ